MLKFSANLSLLFTELPLIERFAAAKQQGFKAVEIQFPYSLSCHTLKKILREQQLELVLFNVDAGDLMQGGAGLACVPERQDAFKKAVMQAVVFAKELKPHAINVLAGRSKDELLRETYLNTFRENLVFTADLLTPLGIKTVFEAINTVDMPDFLIHRGEQMLNILTELNRPDIFMQYDIYHALKMGDNPVDFISRHGEKIAHIQFADSPGRGQPGSGLVDFEKLFSVIDASGYLGYLGAEYKPVGSTEDSLDWFKFYQRVGADKSAPTTNQGLFTGIKKTI